MIGLIVFMSIMPIFGFIMLGFNFGEWLEDKYNIEDLNLGLAFGVTFPIAYMCFLISIAEYFNLIK